MQEDLSQHYFLGLAAAFIRGRRPDAPALEPPELLIWGRDQGLKIHKFKRNTELPRVRKVLGMLRGLTPDALIDIGSGRGTFLWPLMDELPELPVTAVDQDPVRVRDIDAVRLGGIERLIAIEADARDLPLPDQSADGATLLEVLEHMERPERAVKEAARVARRFLIASVPSQEDNNPEHIHLFDGKTLAGMMEDAGAVRVQVEYVRGHIVALAQLRG